MLIKMEKKKIKNLNNCLNLHYFYDRDTKFKFNFGRNFQQK